MSDIKERILGAVTVMSEEDAKILWNNIIKYYSDKMWDGIEAEEPDEADLSMLEDINTNPECSEFVSSEQLKSALGCNRK